jgi:hypothetical protein
MKRRITPRGRASNMNLTMAKVTSPTRGTRRMVVDIRNPMEEATRRKMVEVVITPTASARSVGTRTIVIIGRVVFSIRTARNSMPRTLKSFSTIKQTELTLGIVTSIKDGRTSNATAADTIKETAAIKAVVEAKDTKAVVAIKVVAVVVEVVVIKVVAEAVVVVTTTTTVTTVTTVTTIITKVKAKVITTMGMGTITITKEETITTKVGTETTKVEEETTTKEEDTIFKRMATSSSSSSSSSSRTKGATLTILVELYLLKRPQATVIFDTPSRKAP